MELLLDTNILLFMAYEPEKLNSVITGLLEDTSNKLSFSAASVWEVVIKSQLNKPGFSVDAGELREGLFDSGLIEIPVKGEHALGILSLPEELHKDPFDRLIVAQAKICELSLVTSDKKLTDTVSDYIDVIANT